MAVCKLIVALSFLSLSTTTAHEHIRVDSWIVTDNDHGPVIKIFCKKLQYDCSSNICTFVWKFAGKTLAENEDLKDADSSRYKLDFGETDVGYGSLLKIKYAQKEDSGVYECQVAIEGSLPSSATTRVTAHYYLPPDEYPECSVSPSMSFTENSHATFTCITGEASPSMNLKLTLESKDGSLVEISDYYTVSKTITAEDNNTMFICHMTNVMFPSVDCTCSVGPLRVLPMSVSSVTKLPSSASITKNTDIRISHLPNGTDKHTSTGKKKSLGTYSTWILISGIISAVLIILTLILFITLLVRNIKSKNKNLNDAATNENNIEMCKSKYEANKGKDCEQSPLYAEIHTTGDHDTHSNPNDPISSKSTEGNKDETLGQESLYATVRKTDDHDRSAINPNETNTDCATSQCDSEQASLYAVISKTHNSQTNLLDGSDSEANCVNSDENSCQKPSSAATHSEIGIRDSNQVTSVDIIKQDGKHLTVSDKTETSLPTSGEIAPNHENPEQSPLYSEVNKTGHSINNSNDIDDHLPTATSDISDQTSIYALVQTTGGEESLRESNHCLDLGASQDYSDQDPLYAMVQK